MSDTTKKFDFLKIGLLGRKKPARDPKYATFNRRMMAATLDSTLFLIISPLFDLISPINRSTLPQYMPDPNSEMAMRGWASEIMTNPDFVSSLAANWTWQIFTLLAFSGICWHFWAATPGKIIMRIKVVDYQTEAPISDMQIALRLVGYLISGFGLMIGFFWMGINKERRGWHDLTAGTAVITIPWRKKENNAS